MDSITQFLNLEDSELYTSEISTNNLCKTITISTKIKDMFCPKCEARMYSKGIYKRKINHPVLQNGYRVNIILNQRRWRCTNPNCLYTCNDTFRFVNKSRRNTNASDMLIVNAFRDLDASVASIARRFNTTDTHVLDIFDRYVKLDRLPLSSIISLDEVYMNLDDHSKYSLVIQDFFTGNPIDILRSRRSDIFTPYFEAIPRAERENVTHVITDMYSPYFNLTQTFFPNAQTIVDSFHVIQLINRDILEYIRKLQKKYRQKDREKAQLLSELYHKEIRIQASDETYLLKNYKWLILKNQSSIEYRLETAMDPHFHMFMNTFDYEKDLFRIDPRLERLRELKEIYVRFNARYAGKPLEAQKELESIIYRYLHCEDPIFNNFANLLIRYSQQIINSFIMVEKYGPGGLYDSRLSNGPIESLNRKIKDLKRLGRGYRNFEHFRNRFLFATRDNPVLNGTNVDK